MIQSIADLKKSENFFLLAGPCVIEGEDMALRIAERVVKMTDKLNIPYIFKGSYRKANRSRLDSFTGIGDEKALKILAKVRDSFGVPVVTDIHAADEAAMAAEYVDVLQIPAFLCRQTDILVAAAKTGKIVNIKKGQFLSPGAMRFAADKVAEAGNKEVMLTERGVKCWMAPYSIPTGSSYQTEIPSALSNTPNVLLVLSKEAETSRWVQKEWCKKSDFVRHKGKSDMLPSR